MSCCPVAAPLPEADNEECALVLGTWHSGFPQGGDCGCEATGEKFRLCRFRKTLDSTKALRIVPRCDLIDELGAVSFPDGETETGDPANPAPGLATATNQVCDATIDLGQGFMATYCVDLDTTGDTFRVHVILHFPEASEESEKLFPPPLDMEGVPVESNPPNWIVQHDVFYEACGDGAVPEDIVLPSSVSVSQQGSITLPGSYTLTFEWDPVPASAPILTYPGVDFHLRMTSPVYP